MMAVDRPPSFSVWVLSLVVCSSLVVGPVGKWETRLHRVFHFSIRAGSPFFFGSFFFTNNPHFLRLFCRFERLPPGAGSLFGRSGTVAVDGQLQDHRVMHDAIDGGGRGHGVLEDLIP